MIKSTAIKQDLQIARKHKFLNRQGLNMAVRFSKTNINLAKGNIFILHGFASSMDEHYISSFSITLNKLGFNTISIDATNSFNSAEGNISNHSYDTHYNDLEDAINWSQKEYNIKEPFALMGHSLGAMACLLYAQNHLDQISFIITASAIISGELLEKAYRENIPKIYNKWKSTDNQNFTSNIPPYQKGSRKFSWLTSMAKHNTIKDAANIKSPTLMIAGTSDSRSPLEYQHKLYNSLTCKKQISSIESAGHIFNNQETKKSAEIIKNWINNNF